MSRDDSNRDGGGHKRGDRKRDGDSDRHRDKDQRHRDEKDKYNARRRNDKEMDKKSDRDRGAKTSRSRTARKVREQHFVRPQYGVSWMDECYDKVDKDNERSMDFLAKVNELLSTKVRGELDNEAKQQALFVLLGEDYVRLHFPHHRYSRVVRKELSSKVNLNLALLDALQIRTRITGIAKHENGGTGTNFQELITPFLLLRRSEKVTCVR